MNTAANTNILIFPKQPKKKAEQPKKKKLRKYEREDGRFCKRVTVNGETKAFYGTSTADVEKQAREYKELLSHGLVKNDYDITVEEWSKTWFEAEMQGKSYNHKYNMQRQLDLINAEIGQVRVRDVREIHLVKIINSRSSLSKSQISKLHNVTQRLFSSARKNHIIIVDPAIDLKKPKGTYTGHRALEPWEMDLLIDHCDCCAAGIWAVTMMLSGLRRGEALAIKCKDFDFDSGMINVSDAVAFEGNKAVNQDKTKTEAGERSTPMLNPLSGILKADFEAHPREDFAVQMTGGKISPSSFRYQWNLLMHKLTLVRSGYAPTKATPKNPEKRAAFEASLTPVHFTPHDLRYTYATILYDADVDEKTAQKWLGHTSPEMTRDLYAKLTAERKAKSDTNLVQYFKRFERN